METSRRQLLDSSGELTQSADLDCLLDAPLLPNQKLEADIRRIFIPIRTVCMSIVLLLVQVAFVTLTLVSGYFCLLHGEDDKCMQYTKPLELNTIVIICKVILWLLHLVFERFLQYHHMKAKSRGYLQLYRSTNTLTIIPLTINSTGNAALLLIISSKDFLNDNNLYLYLIWSVLILELILTVIFLLMYTVHICKFNRRKLDADIIEQQRKHDCAPDPLPGIGFRYQSDLEEVIEKQGEEIVALQRHSEHVCRLLLSVMEELRNAQASQQ
ncbi:transmembrane protein 192 isoform X1 [Lithobates pipiens]